MKTKKFELPFREIASDDDELLAEDTFIDKTAAVMLQSCYTHYVMLQRNLIYTGITRAKKICVLIGTKKALAFAIRSMSVLKRNTRLKEQLTSMH